MNVDTLLSEQEVQYKLSSLFFGLLLVALIFLALYILWKWCGEESNNSAGSKSASGERLFMKPVYAHEIEPGIVVLQSENGDYFKILKEYDMKGGNQYGSLSCTKPELTQPNRETEMLSSLPQSSCQSSDFPLHASAPPCLNDDVNSRMLERRSNGAEFRSVDFNFGSGTNPPPYGVQ